MARLNLKRKSRERASHPGRRERAVSEKAAHIIIDQSKGLVFESEEQLYEHFATQIHQLEERFFKERRESHDLSLEEFTQYEDLLSLVLEDPDEIWEDTQSLADQSVFVYIGRFEVDGKDVFYAALTFVTDNTPSFVYLHFPTIDPDLIEKYRQGTLVYDRIVKDVEKGAIEGDALSEGDELAVGLYKSMLKLRSERDLGEEEFRQYIDLREECIEEADEIWRNHDLQGNTLVSFIKDVSTPELPDLHYVVVTVEDAPSGSHALLFSFPTRDTTLLDRYRHGENLQAEEVVQEASH